MESALHVSPRWPQARGGTKRFRQHVRNQKPETRNQEPETRTRERVAQFVSAPAGLGFRPARETSAVRSHAKSQRTQRGLPGSEPVAVVADAAWNRLCTSLQDGRKLGGGRKDFGNTLETRNQEPETRTRERVAQFVSAPCRFGIPACTRNLGGSISRKVAAHATGPSGFGARGGRCGRCVESALHVSPRWPQARGGTKRFRQHVRNQKPEPESVLPNSSQPLPVWDSGLHAKPRRFDLTQSRSARNGAFRVRNPWRSLRTLRGVGSARLAGRATRVRTGLRGFGQHAPSPFGFLRPNSEGRASDVQN